MINGTKLRKAIFLKFLSLKTGFIIGLVLLVAILVLTLNYFNSVKADNFQYTENFLATTYKDSGLTTGKWDTTLGQARLFGKDWVNQAKTKDQAEAIINNSSDSGSPQFA